MARLPPPRVVSRAWGRTIDLRRVGVDDHRSGYHGAGLKPEAKEETRAAVADRP
jgi:hypothetical protein